MHLKIMAGVRERLIHEYSEVDLDLVWETRSFIREKIKGDDMISSE
ncbi:MAG: HepT-like ribonuclease domain-containing protein [Candidatus Thorarchaeota archaeon]